MGAVALVLAVIVLTTTGCATLTHPMIDSPIPSNGKTTCDSWDNARDALGCAEVARRAMADHASDQALVPRVIGAVLIPLSAAIAGLAMTGTTGAPITALTLAGVATMGEGFWLTNPERRRVYRVGERAVQCVIRTMQPFESLDVKSFADAERALGAAIQATDAEVRDAGTKLAVAKAKFAAYSAAMRAPQATPAAKARAKELLQDEERLLETEESATHEVIAAAREALTTARHVDRRAQTLLKRAYGAPAEIRTSVEEIIGVVNEEIDKTEPTMDMVRQALAAQDQLRTAAFDSLDALISSSRTRSQQAQQAEAAITATASRIATASAVPGTLSPDEQRTLDEWNAALSELRAARTVLKDSQPTLIDRAADVSKVLDTARNPGPAEACVNAAKGGVAAKPLMVDFQRPDQVAPDPVLAGETVTFIVSGGSGDVQVVTADADAKAALEVQVNPVSGVKVVTAQVKSDAKPGTYLIDVTDNVNGKPVSNKIVKIVVKASPPAPLKIAGTDPTTPPAANTVVVYTATGGSGTGAATLTPQTGFGPPKASVVGDTCVISLAWVGPAPKAERPYKLEVTWGQQAGAQTFTMKPK